MGVLSQGQHVVGVRKGAANTSSWALGSWCARCSWWPLGTNVPWGSWWAPQSTELGFLKQGGNVTVGARQAGGPWRSLYVQHPTFIHKSQNAISHFLGVKSGIATTASGGARWAGGARHIPPHLIPLQKYNDVIDRHRARGTRRAWGTRSSTDVTGPLDISNDAGSQIIQRVTACPRGSGRAGGPLGANQGLPDCVTLEVLCQVLTEICATSPIPPWGSRGPGWARGSLYASGA